MSHGGAIISSDNLDPMFSDFADYGHVALYNYNKRSFKLSRVVLAEDSNNKYNTIHLKFRGKFKT